MKRSASILMLALAIGCSPQPNNRSNAPTAEGAASRFTAGEAGLAGYVRLDGDELRALVVGHEIRAGGPVPQEMFMPGGGVFVFSEMGPIEESYVIVGDALCRTLEERWLCRRLYRDGTGRFFQVLEGNSNEPFPIEVR